MSTTILHLTDLHFGSDQTVTDKAQRKLCLDGLLQIFKNQKDTSWKPSIVCLSGDIGWSGKTEDYTVAKIWLDELLSICGISYKEVIVCPGNHDLLRARTRGIKSPNTRSEAEKHLEYPIPDMFKSPFENYSIFCESAGIPSYQFGDDGSYLVGERIVQGIRFIALNSAWYCSSGNDKENLWMGCNHMELMSAQGQMPFLSSSTSNLLTIGLMHHPFEWLNPAETNGWADLKNTKDYFSHRTHIILTGHDHAEFRRPDKIAQGAYHFRSPATFVNSNYPNGFRLLKIDNTNLTYCEYQYKSTSTNYEWKAADFENLEIDRLEQSIQIPPFSGIEINGKKKDATVTNVFQSLKIRTPQSQSSPLQRQLNNIPSAPHDIIGRKDEIQKLSDVLTISKSPILVQGIFGLGKTTFAKTFANQNLNKYDHLIWLSINEENAKPVNEKGSGQVKSILANDPLLIRNLAIDFEGKETEDVRFDVIINELRNLSGQNLLIIDNVGLDGGKREVYQKLPQPPNWHVIITSRYNLTGYVNFELKKLLPNDGMALFRSFCLLEGEDSAIQQLLEIIDYHTLTTELFAKTLSALNGSLSVSDLLTKVKERKLHDSNIQIKIETEHSGQELEIFFHLMIAFDLSQLLNEEIYVLRLLALFPPDRYSIKDQFANWMQIEDPLEIKNFCGSVAQLVKKGWITQTDGKIQIHRIIQELISYKEKLEWKDVEKIVDSMNIYLDPLKNSLEQTWEYHDIGDFVLKSLNQDSVGFEKKEFLIFSNHLAVVKHNMGRFQEAADILAPLIPKLNKILDSNDPMIAVTKSHLGLIYQDLEKFKEAYILLNEALSFDEQNNAPNSVLMVRLNNLAMIYKDIKQPKKAIETLNIAINMTLEEVPRNYSSLATKYSNLAMLYKGMGNLDSAIGLLTYAISIEADTLSQSIWRLNLADIYRQKTQFQKALSLCDAGLFSMKADNKQDHPLTLKLEKLKASIYLDKGEFKIALGLLQSLKSRYDAISGLGYSNIAPILSDMGFCYLGLGNHQKAIEMFGAALSLDELGNNLENLAKSKFNLAITLLQQRKQLVRARQLLVETRSYFTSEHDENHPIAEDCRRALKDINLILK